MKLAQVTDRYYEEEWGITPEVQTEIDQASNEYDEQRQTEYDAQRANLKSHIDQISDTASFIHFVGEYSDNAAMKKGLRSKSSEEELRYLSQKAIQIQDPWLAYVIVSAYDNPPLDYISAIASLGKGLPPEYLLGMIRNFPEMDVVSPLRTTFYGLSQKCNTESSKAIFDLLPHAPQELKNEVATQMGQNCGPHDLSKLLEEFTISDEVAVQAANQMIDKLFEMLGTPVAPNHFGMFKMFEKYVDMPAVVHRFLDGQLDSGTMVFYKMFKEYFDHKAAIKFLKLYISNRGMGAYKVLKEIDEKFDIPHHIMAKSYLVSPFEHSEQEILEFLDRHKDINGKILKFIMAFVMRRSDTHEMGAFFKQLFYRMPQRSKELKFLANNAIGEKEAEGIIQDALDFETWGLRITKSIHHSQTPEDDEDEGYYIDPESEEGGGSLTGVATIKGDIVLPIVLNGVRHELGQNEKSRLFGQLLGVFLVKNKKTAEVMYNEFLKNNAIELAILADGVKDYHNEIAGMWHIVEKAAERSPSTDKYFKYLRRLMRLADIRHNNSTIPKKILEPIFFNKSIDLTQNYVKQFLEIYTHLHHFLVQEEDGEFRLLDVKTISQQTPELLDVDRLMMAISKFQEVSKAFENNSGRIKVDREFLDFLIYLQTEIAKIRQYSALQKYYGLATNRPKNKALFNLDMEFDGFTFKVIKDLDPYHFEIGQDTDCCQRIGGEGEEAAIDSFINPLAGVLVLYKDNKVLAQSYFHYVPKHNGYILDNVEANMKNLEAAGFDISADEESSKLSKLYTEYATKLKAKFPKIKYLKVGLSYSKLDDGPFEIVKEKKDPRQFSVDEPYSDFSKKKHIDLLRPKTAGTYIGEIVQHVASFEIFAYS